MKTKISGIKRLTPNDKIEIERYSERLNKTILKRTIINILMLLVILVTSILLMNKISPISVIGFSIYCPVIIGFLLIIMIYFFFSKNDVFDLNVLKRKYTLSKVFDNIFFLFKSFAVVIFITFFFLSPATVSGASMENAYSNNDKVLVWQAFYKPKTNDVVIIDTIDLDLIIKRVVATHKDTVEYKDNALYVNDKFVENVTQDEYNKMLTFNNKKYDSVPEGYCIVLGDNRSNSIDSRRFGLVSNEKVIGRVIFTVFPFSNFGF